MDPSLPSSLPGHLNSLTELSDSLKDMLRGPDFMTKCIFPGLEKTLNLVGFLPSPGRALGLPVSEVRGNFVGSN